MDSYDLLIIGGGINGTAIARDAAGRGLSMLLVEQDDLAQHTSSASSKLIHGGLRYLEQGEFRLVRESLRERAILLRTAPHIVTPLRFVLPLADGMRPAWMLLAGLSLYDLFARGGGLPSARRLTPADAALTEPLQGEPRGFTYWDAWVDDARLVVLNALDAAERGAEIATRTRLERATRDNGRWRAELSDGRSVIPKMIVNAAGPWVTEVLGQRLGGSGASRARLVRGSHIVVPSLFDGDHAYILQQPDGRIVFAIAYEDEYTLIGTTDLPVDNPGDTQISAEEIDYLRAAANRGFRLTIERDNVVWSYAGIRALYDDGRESAQTVTRDYRLELDPTPGARLLSVFGGKLTTARALAEEALAKLQVKGRRWTRDVYLPGGEMNDEWDDSYEQFLRTIKRWIDPTLLDRLARSYGARIADLIGSAASMTDLGRHFSAGLYQLEIDYLRRVEFARTADDILWRRTKLGLHMTEAQRDAVAEYLG